MDEKLKEYRDKSYAIKMKIALETDVKKKNMLILEEKELMKEYRKFVFELKNCEYKGGRRK